MHKITILQILRGAPSNGQLAVSLRTEMNARQGERIGDIEFAEVLREMTEKGLIETEEDRLFGDKRVKLTADGWGVARTI